MEIYQFVRDGYNIDGFDILSEMLERCKLKIRAFDNKCTL
jgi:hypothetical protein